MKGERSPHDNTLLRPYRVLDLTEGGFLICGKMLADMGADVVVVEKPGGSPTRSVGPFFGDAFDPEKSLFWFAYNADKKGMTLDLEGRTGQELFKKLVKRADFVLESFRPGHMDSLGLGYSALSEINPHVIVASITPFGQTGPHACYKGPEVVVWARGGFMSLCGETDRPPVWVSFPQAYLHAGAEAATACMIALHHRLATGEGQHIDVSAQEAAIVTTSNAWVHYAASGFIMNRSGSYYINPVSGTKQCQVFACKDGEIFIWIGGGGLAVEAGSSRALAQWMAEEGAAPAWLETLDWKNDYQVSKRTQDLIDRIEKTVAQFVRSKTKRELYDEAVKRGIMMAPVSTAKELAESSQLQARDFWEELEHPELNKSLTYCGPFVKLSETPLLLKHRAPLLGEHNEEVYAEVGIDSEGLNELRLKGVV